MGETEKYIEAVFSLAKKIAPCIIFIDEIDALTRRRGPGDMGYTASMKSQLLMQWDGLTSHCSSVIVLGATNRKEDIDEAFMRRMPLQIYVGLPDCAEREEILKILLKDDLASLHNPFEYDLISKHTLGFSGSDLKELCRSCLVECEEPVTTEDFLSLIPSIAR